MIRFNQALQIVELSLEIARQEQFAPMCVVLVDPAGNIVCSGRDDGANFLRFKIAHGKAVAAAGMQINTRQLLKKANDMSMFFNSITASIDQPFIPQTGAVVILQDDQILGAVGVSGGTGDQDEHVVIKAIEQLKLTWK